MGRGSGPAHHQTSQGTDNFKALHLSQQNLTMVSNLLVTKSGVGDNLVVFTFRLLVFSLHVENIIFLNTFRFDQRAPVVS